MCRNSRRAIKGGAPTRLAFSVAHRTLVALAAVAACGLAATPARAEIGPAAYSFDTSDNPLPFPYSDFAPGELKAECGSGGPVAGVSASVNGNAHSVLCETPSHDGLQYPFDSTAVTEVFSTSNSADFGGRGDWDPGYLKGECAVGNVVNGVAQTVSGQIDRLECTHYALGPSDVSTNTCQAHTFPGDYPSPFWYNDWAYGNYKLECDAGTTLVGVSADVNAHHPHAILCCNMNAEATWSTNRLCGFNMNGPEAFGFTAAGLETVWSSNGGASWAHQPIITPTVVPASTAMSCASDGSNQAIVLFREAGNEHLRAVDRLSGWQTTLLDLSNINSAGMTGTLVYDQGRYKFVFFVSYGTGQIMRIVWDDSTSPKQTTSILSVPSGFSSTAPDSLASYAVNIGPGASVGVVSLYLVSDSGQLWEYSGPLTGAGQWNWSNYGAPSHGLSNAAGFGPTAFAAYGSLSGHPGNYYLGEYNRWITLPTADGQYVYTYYSPAGMGPGNYFTWVQLGEPYVQRMTGGTARGCTSPGEPCVATSAFAGLTDTALRWYYGGTTDGSTTPAAGWRTFDLVTTIRNSPLAFVAPSWTNLGGVFFFGADNSTGVDFLDLDTQVVTRL